MANILQKYFPMIRTREAVWQEISEKEKLLEIYRQWNREQQLSLIHIFATAKAADAIARQPEAEGKISKTLILGCALAEATAIYGFIIAILIIFFLQ